MNITAQYFDGKSSACKEASVYIGLDRTLRLTIEGRTQSYKASRYQVIPTVGKATLRVRLSDGGALEFPHTAAALEAFKTQIPTVDKFVGRIESRWRLSIVAVFGAVAVCIFLYMVALPWAADKLAPMVPITFKEEFGRQALSVLDSLMFKESKRSSSKDGELGRVLISLAHIASTREDLQLLVRRMGEGKHQIPNAFALLPRTVVVTEGLIDLLPPDEMEGVLAHELGHLVHDHGTQMLIRSSTASLISLSIFGGDPGIIHTLAISLAESRYSQENESEADAFAVELLKKHGSDPLVLARALGRLSGSAEEGVIEGYLSSHPLTSERIRTIEALAKKP